MADKISVLDKKLEEYNMYVMESLAIIQGVKSEVFQAENALYEAKCQLDDAVRICTQEADRLFEEIHTEKIIELALKGPRYE